MKIPPTTQIRRVLWMLPILLLFHVTRAAPLPTPAPASGATLFTPAGPVYLWYQADSKSSFRSNSQNYEPANDAFDDQSADDFIVPAGATWTVQYVGVEGQYRADSTGPATSVNVFFYFNSGTLPGAPVPGGTFLDVPMNDEKGDFIIDLSSGVVLTEGLYWVSVQANMSVATGRWFWRDHTLSRGFGAVWQNPGGGFGNECTTWGIRADCFATPDPDQSFYLFGTITLSTAKALNISTRLRIETGDNVLIGGFIISGPAPKNVALRGIGPSLIPLGISDALADPTLELRAANGSLISQNDDWQSDSAQAAQLTALGLALQDPKESGLIATLQPGAAYTAMLAGNSGGTGVGLVEIYDTNQEASSELANISTRGFVRTGNNVMIGGFILGGSSNNTQVAVRGIGPSLALIGSTLCWLIRLWNCATAMAPF